MLSNRSTTHQKTGRWPLIGMIVLFFVALFIAATIVVSLIPVYISSKSATFKSASSPLYTLSYDISGTNITGARSLETLPPNALSYLQKKFAKHVNSDKQTADSRVTVVSGELNTISSGRRRRQTDESIIQLIIVIQVVYGKLCSSGKCRKSLETLLYKLNLEDLDFDVCEFIESIVNDPTMSTINLSITLTCSNTPTTMSSSTETNTASTIIANSITTTFSSITNNITASISGIPTTPTTAQPNITTTIFSSDGTGSYSPYPSTTISSGKRRRRHIIQSSQLNSHMPIAGCLIIAPDKKNTTSKQYMYKHHTFVKHLPLGIQHIPPVDGQQIDLFTYLQQNKISKTTYNDIVVQDRIIHGQLLTPGALGCLESHVRAWERVVEVNQPMLILEDDVHLEQDLFDSMLPYLLYSLPTNFSLLYFGNLVGKEMESKLVDYSDLLWKMKGANWCTHAYLISPQAAATLLDYIYPAYAQVDSMIIDIATSQSFEVFMSKQILARADNKYGRLSRIQRYFVAPIVIPRTFHFIWLTGNTLSGKAQKNVDLWKKLHPNWQIIIWTNESIYNNISTIYNKFRFEKSARSPRQASDIIRYEIIYQYGGIYLDVDFEPLQNIEPLLHDIEAFVVYENEYFVCNGIFGAIPGHDLTLKLVTQLETSWTDHENGTVNQQTGPFHMTEQVQALKEENKTGLKNKFQMFAPHLFFPYAWYEKDPGSSYDPLAYAVHHFRPVAEIERDGKERT